MGCGSSLSRKVEYGAPAGAVAAAAAAAPSGAVGPSSGSAASSSGSAQPSQAPKPEQPPPVQEPEAKIAGHNPVFLRCPSPELGGEPQKSASSDAVPHSEPPDEQPAEQEAVDARAEAEAEALSEVRLSEVPAAEATSEPPGAADAEGEAVEEPKAEGAEEEKEEAGPPEDDWKSLIERGEVRPDLAWHDAAAADAQRTLEWYLSSREELLELRDDQKRTALHAAAQGGAAKSCEWLLRRQADPCAQDRTRATPLHLAALQGHKALCQLLLEGSEGLSTDGWPDVASADLWRRTPLHKASEGGSPQVIALLLKHKANMDKADREGETCLHKAVAAGHEAAVASLASRPRAPLDVTNSEGFSPLDLCVKHCAEKAGDALVTAGAKLQKDVRKKPPTLLDAARAGLPFLCTYIFRWDPGTGPSSVKKQLAQADDAGRTPLLLAANAGSSELLRRLLDGRAAPEAAAAGGRQAFHEASAAGHEAAAALLLERRAELGAADGSGRTALFYAAEEGHVAQCQWLLEQGLRAEACDDQERTPLHAAAAAGRPAVCEALLESTGGEAQAQELLGAEDWEGISAAFLAVREGHVNVCKLLAAQKAELNATLDFGNTALQAAAERGHGEVLQLLLADVVAAGGGALEAASAFRVSDRRNAWLLAAAGGHVACCRQLREAAGPDLGATVDRDGRNAVLLAALGGHIEVCSWLLEVEASPPGLASVDACEWTPLHAASSAGHKEAVQWLLEASADLAAKDSDGRTARDWAGLRGRLAVEALLRDAEKKAAAEAAAKAD